MHHLWRQIVMVGLLLVAAAPPVYAETYETLDGRIIDRRGLDAYDVGRDASRGVLAPPITLDVPDPTLAGYFTLVDETRPLPEGWTLPPAWEDEDLRAAASAETNYGVDFSDRAIPVRKRLRPDYEPLGVTVGSFRFFSAAQLGVEYDSNVFRKSQLGARQALAAGSIRSKDDLIYQTQGEVAARSNWGRHYLAFGAGFANRQFRDNEDDSVFNYRGEVQGRIDIDRGLSVGGSFMAAQLHEARGGNFTPADAAKPVPYMLYRSTGSLTRIWNRLASVTEVEHSRLDYSDVPSLNGTILDQQPRNGEVLKVRQTVEYEVRPGLVVVTEGRGDFRDYRGTPTSDPDSRGYMVRSGAAFEISRLTYGRVLGGYLSQWFEDPTVGKVDGFTFIGELIWNPSPLWTVTLAASRDFSQSLTTDAPKELDTIISLTIDHELRRNLIVSPRYRFEIDDFKVSGKQDVIHGLGMLVTYSTSRFAHLRAEYEYAVRDGPATNDLTAHRIYLGAEVKF